ncbi:hypothetical protein CEXT_678981 [Caerostris extrusa]|uniref:Uncharacterized protein n=1 Tax=Caerostris extrusa TaxID=172846 RepID=A0AAV4NCN2_CAEEX|nr:hypothetical protein CEXT_678981 [Caerostris extrusa]
MYSALNVAILSSLNLRTWNFNQYCEICFHPLLLQSRSLFQEVTSGEKRTPSLRCLFRLEQLAGRRCRGDCFKYLPHLCLPVGFDYVPKMSASPPPFVLLCDMRHTGLTAGR